MFSQCRDNNKLLIMQTTKSRSFVRQHELNEEILWHFNFDVIDKASSISTAFDELTDLRITFKDGLYDLQYFCEENEFNFFSLRILNKIELMTMVCPDEFGQQELQRPQQDFSLAWIQCV